MKLFAVLFLMSSLLSGCIVTVDGPQPPKKNHHAASKSYFELGAAYMQKGRYDLAEPKLLRSIKLHPNADAYNALAVLYEEQRKNLLAEENYSLLIKKFPFYARGYLNYSIFLCKYNRENQLTELVNHMKKNTKSIAALGQIAAGNCAIGKKRNAAARAFYTEALKFDRYAAGALLPLAELDMQAGLLGAAKDKVETVHNYIGYSEGSLQLAIRIAKKMDQPAVAKKMEAELISRFPNSPQAQQVSGSR